MRIRITPRRLERLAAQFAPLPSEPQVLWTILVNTALVGDDREALIAAIQAVVWDELTPFAMRGEILASLYVFDAHRAQMEAVGYWWDLTLDIAPGQLTAAIIDRGMRPWLKRILGEGKGDDTDATVRKREDEREQKTKGRSSWRNRPSMAWLD
jgi:hypothetical protein